MDKNVYNVILVDNNNNFYGTWKINTSYKEDILHLVIKNTIIDMFKNMENFLEDFEVNLCKIYVKLCEDEHISNVDYEYFNSDILNIDEIF